MIQPRVHTWTFVAQSSVGTTVTLRAYRADPPLDRADAITHELIDLSHPVLVTNDGELVERLDQGLYAVTTTGMIVASMDPHAP